MSQAPSAIGDIIIWGPAPPPDQIRHTRFALPASWAGGTSQLLVAAEGQDGGSELGSALVEWLQPWGISQLSDGQTDGLDLARAAAAAARRGCRVLVVTQGAPWEDEAARALLAERAGGGFHLQVLERVDGVRCCSPAETPVDRLEAIMLRLLAPDGCPWDREQTHRTLRPYVVEEAAEVIEAIERGDPAKIADELGDLLLQIAFHAALADEQGAFRLADVAAAIETKMLHRHPHVFADWQVGDAADVLHNWDLLKATEQAAAGDIGETGPWRPLRKGAVQVSLSALTMGFAAARGDRGGYEEARQELETELQRLVDCAEDALETRHQSC